MTFGQAKLSYSLGIISSSEKVQYLRNFKIVVPDKVLELHLLEQYFCRALKVTCLPPLPLPLF